MDELTRNLKALIDDLDGIHVSHKSLDWLRSYVEVQRLTREKEERKHSYYLAAQQVHGDDEHEFDTDYKVSECPEDKGAWVQGWMWVGNAEAGLSDEEEVEGE